MDQLPDKIITRGILEHKSHVIQYVYKEFFPMVERMVVNSGGDKEQAKDVFQEGMVIIYKKITKNGLELTCRFSTYLYAVCQKIWLQEKRKNVTRMRLTISEPEMVEDSEPQFHEDSEQIKQILNKHFNNLSKDCQKMLILHFNDTPIEEIQKIMNYQNTHYVMDRKYRCKKSLIQRILNDPKFKSVKNEYYGQIRSVFGE
jgi:RNA polymerase sigma factor (sigma-70 family)